VTAPGSKPPDRIHRARSGA